MAAFPCSATLPLAGCRAPVQLQRALALPRHQCKQRRLETRAESAAASSSRAADPAAGGAAAAGGSDSEDEYLELPEAQHWAVQPSFLDAADELRAHFEERLGNPLAATSGRFCWDWWHVPGQYTLLRTPADQFFPPRLYERLVDALTEYGERQLGCRGISPVWMSCYVSGCRQGLHADAPHGPFAFVLSLTPWEGRRFSGGETLLLQPHVLDYWRRFDSGVGTEMPQLAKLIEPHFNQLTVFDGRLPHGVATVEGTLDPLEGRLVLHGWFTRPSPFFAGSLSEEAATPALNACLEELYAALGQLPPVVGTVSLRLQVDGASGAVRDLAWLANTLVARPQGLDAEHPEPEDAVQHTLATIAEHCLGLRLPPSPDGGDTAITLPVVFE